MILLAVFLGTLCFPLTREAQSLCARLVFHYSDKIEVDGGDPDCRMAIPVAHFSERYAIQLRDRSTSSLGDYIVAFIARPAVTIKFPEPSPALAKDSLLDWAILEIACSAWQQWSLAGTDKQTAHDQVTASAAGQSMQRALQFVQIAQIENPDNGAMWLTEAALLFSNNEQEQAVTALKIAAGKNMWSTGVQTNFERVRMLLQAAGLPRLDSIRETKACAPTHELRLVELKCQSGLSKLAARFITQKNPSRFPELLNLAFQLGKVESPDSGYGLENSFRRYNFFMRDESIEAMASMLGKSALFNINDISRRPDLKLRRQIFKEYASANADPKLVENYLNQIDGYASEKSAFFKIIEPLTLRNYEWSLRSLAAGIFAVLFLAATPTVFCLESAMLFLYRRLAKSKAVPRIKNFYLPLFPCILAATFFLGIICLELGVFRMRQSATEIGMITIREISIAWLVCWLPFLLLIMDDFLGRKKERPIRMEWPWTKVAATLYLLTVILMGFCRHQATILWTV